ncbi:4-galactosyl-N-acetylglucosaminide 3-alpha-L-fucosyltransferase 9-like isoform X1 [Rana temporaria]|uniref:4-galactosyl-N-acetylglucosaminide 3-alpha-L-fucosyltransferase 9-like isoform X1 n=1 Tax=Rana temporaria TaxID=8407 RepID=UPI001AACC4EB|nr:4-galactosyl-N-acetylglucosaminide 3-alpha-L-fucosyltransferase 9-like isoform X1 [Rana temporaria]
MNLACLNQKTIIIFLSLLILLSFFWNFVDITRRNAICAGKTVIQEKSIQNITEKEVIPNLKKEKEVLILIWHWPWGYTFPLDRCHQDFGFPGCKMTTDRSLYSVADGVIIHHVEIMYNKNLLPQQPRPIFQYWVWANVEPPLIIKNVDMLDNLFNMTLTFRQDSDVFVPYGQIETLKEPQSFTIPEKSKLVAWVVSKWYPGVRRSAYYEELKEYIPIDIYGAKHTKLSWDNFHSTISQYKFYLAFENSNYKDYITEKLWSNAFGSWAVPVVLGTSRENYERFIPGDAFIHVDDFPSAKELADYLLELDKDDEKYHKYFNWRSHYRVNILIDWQYRYCQACEVIRKAPKYQILHSVAKWFMKEF